MFETTGCDGDLASITAARITDESGEATTFKVSICFSVEVYRCLTLYSASERRLLTASRLL